MSRDPRELHLKSAGNAYGCESLAFEITEH